MSNKMYLIHEDDYIKHIEDKAILYSMLKQVASKVAKLPVNRGNKKLSTLVKKSEATADSMFWSWGIPTSYLYTCDSDMLGMLMENELIEPEEAGYFACDGERCCEMCESTPTDEEYEEYEIDGWSETVEALNEVIHNFFGDDVTVHIVIE